MKKVSRRRFLKQAGQTGLAVAATSALGRFGIAQTQRVTRVAIDSNRQIAEINPHLFGSFLEQLGRAIYEGIYDPKSKFADADGFRTDVMKEIHDLGVPIIRWPGGNFVSGYNWLDGVGPKAQRPVVLDRAWNSLETNQFGTNEFIEWCGIVGAEPLLGMNFGTGTVEMASNGVTFLDGNLVAGAGITSAILGFGTQSARDALDSRIASAIIEQAATQIFMPNPRAQPEDYCTGFGLTAHELELVRALPPQAHGFLVKHGNHSVVARLDLGDMPDLLAASPGRRA